MALAIHTVRTVFNDAIAGALGVPYLAASIRLPVSSELADRKTDVLWVLRRLIQNSSPSVPSEPATFAPRTQFAAPLLLGLVLEQMSKPQDYRDALDQVRARFAPLREQLREDRGKAQWDEKPQVYMRRFEKHLGTGGATAAIAKDAAITAAQAGATMATGDPGFVTAALKLISVVKPLDLAHRTYLRMWRPEIYVLLNVADEARNLSLLASRIEQIWGTAPDLEQLNHFASLRAGPFLTPTPLI